MKEEIKKGLFERNKSSKTTYKADIIRIELRDTNRDLGSWTPDRISNRAVIKTYNFLIPRKKPFRKEEKKKIPKVKK